MKKNIAPTYLMSTAKTFALMIVNEIHAATDIFQPCSNCCWIWILIRDVMYAVLALAKERRFAINETNFSGFTRVIHIIFFFGLNCCCVCKIFLRNIRLRRFHFRLLLKRKTLSGECLNGHTQNCQGKKLLSLDFWCYCCFSSLSLLR